MDVRALHGQVFKGIRDELVEEFGHRPVWVVVDPSGDDRTVSVVCTDDSLLLINRSKAWQFNLPNKDSMA